MEIFRHCRQPWLNNRHLQLVLHQQQHSRREAINYFGLPRGWLVLTALLLLPAVSVGHISASVYIMGCITRCHQHSSHMSLAIRWLSSFTYCQYAESTCEGVNHGAW
jgi:hypothetical protein